MPFSQDFLRELEDRSPLSEIAAPYVELKRRGRNLVGLCPFHNEKTPSFHIYPENNSFYCFGCNKGGGVFQFVMGAENLAFPDAVRWLAQRAGMQVPEDSANDSMARLRTRILEINREAGRFYYAALYTAEGRPGLEYLRGRGLDDRTIRHFGLGYAPDSGYALVRHLREKGYGQSELTASDMARISRAGNLYDRYRGRVMFPIFDLRGNVVAFGGRILTEEKPKYINTSDTPVYHKSSGLFAMNFAKDAKSRQLILAEGYMDVIALHRAGFTNAIASLGTSLTEEQARVIRRYAEEAVICYDSDEAGQRATQRAIPILKNAGLLVRVITVPGGKDPDEFMRMHGENGPARFKQLLESGGTDTEYRLARVRMKYDLDTEEGKTRYLREAVDAVLAPLDGMERDVYAGRLAQETGVSRAAVTEAAQRAAQQVRRRRRREEDKAQQQVNAARTGMDPEKSSHIREAQAEEILLAYLYRNPEKAGELAALLPPEKFVTRIDRVLYTALLGKASSGGDALSVGTLSQELGAEEIAELTRVLSLWQEQPPAAADAQKAARILGEERKLSPREIENASPQELRDILARLKRQKGGENPS